MNHILREIKLSKLTDTPMSMEASMLVRFWETLWYDMKVRVDPIKGEIKCWKDVYDYYYFHQDDKNDSLWCDHNTVWPFFRRNLRLNYKETQELIRQMVVETLNCVVNTPLSNEPLPLLVVDETLNCVVNISETEINNILNY